MIDYDRFNFIGNISALDVKMNELVHQPLVDIPVVSVSVTVTVCFASVARISSVQAAYLRASCFLSLASIRAPPALLSMSGGWPNNEHLQDCVVL